MPYLREEMEGLIHECKKKLKNNNDSMIPNMTSFIYQTEKFKKCNLLNVRISQVIFCIAPVANVWLGRSCTSSAEAQKLHKSSNRCKYITNPGVVCHNLHQMRIPLYKWVKTVTSSIFMYCRSNEL